MKTDGPEILMDRILISDLADKNTAVLDFLRENRIGKTDVTSENQKPKIVQFCGLLTKGTECSYVFLPRQSQWGSREFNLSTAALTMQVLAKYGRDVEARKGGSEGEYGATGHLFIIKELADDFRNNGIYSDRTRLKALNSGKPDWNRTIIKERPFITKNNSPIYHQLRTTRTKDSHENLLAQIQAEVLREILNHHGWWLDGIRTKKAELDFFPKPLIARETWQQRLRSLLPTLYANRPIQLAHQLIEYLEDTQGQSKGEFIYGIEDFHFIWERMLKDVLEGVDDRWNSRLPKPAYKSRHTGDLVWRRRGMQMDVVIKKGDHLTIVDAKYYRAEGEDSVPGWGDIAKQLFYEIALKKVSGEHSVSNCFAFPTNKQAADEFKSAAVFLKDQSRIEELPKIDIVYLDIIKIMRAYVAGNKMELLNSP